MPLHHTFTPFFNFSDFPLWQRWLKFTPPFKKGRGSELCIHYAHLTSLALEHPVCDESLLSSFINISISLYIPLHTRRMYIYIYIYIYVYIHIYIYLSWTHTIEMGMVLIKTIKIELNRKMPGRIIGNFSRLPKFSFLRLLASQIECSFFISFYSFSFSTTCFWYVFFSIYVKKKINSYTDIQIYIQYIIYMIYHNIYNIYTYNI